MARAAKKKAGSVRVNFKGVESRQTPAEGDYLVEVLEAKEGTSSSSGGQQIEFVLEIAEGKYKGAKLWFYCPLAENSLWKLHAFLTALGQEVPEDEMDIDLADLVGERCVGVIAHEVYNGKKRAKMTDFDSADNYKAPDEEDDEKEEKSSKKSKKDKKSDKEDDDGAKGKKDDKAAKGGKKDKKAKKVSREDVEDMDEGELQELLEKHKLDDDVDLSDFSKLKKKVAAVIKALEDADLLAD